MKKWLKRLIIIIVLLGVLGGVGYTGYTRYKDKIETFATKRGEEELDTSIPVAAHIAREGEVDGRSEERKREVGGCTVCSTGVCPGVCIHDVRSDGKRGGAAQVRKGLCDARAPAGPQRNIAPAPRAG